MKITHDNAYALGDRVRFIGRDTPRGTIVGRRWRLNGELRYYVVRWDPAKLVDGFEERIIHSQITLIGDGDV